MVRTGENHQRTKHVERRHFFIRDMLKALELRVPLVPTSWDLGHGTPADFLTNTIYYDVYINIY